MGVAEISAMPALVGASSFAWAAVFQESERGTPFPRHPAAQRPAPSTGQAGKSRGRGPKRGFQARPSYRRTKRFLRLPTGL